MIPKVCCISVFIKIMLVLALQQATSQVPQLITYQARLVDPGTHLPVPDGVYAITFSLYDAASGGELLWTEPQNVQLLNGIYSVLLGSLNPLSNELFLGAQRYLGITVGTDPEMVPRKQLVSVPYALRAQTAESITGAVTDTTMWKKNNNNLFYNQGNVGIGTTTPDSSAALEIKSNTLGFLPPRMNQDERDSIQPAEGLMIYNTSTRKPNYFDGTIWRNYDGTSAATIPITDGDGNVYHKVIIGTQTWLVENLKATKYNDGTEIPVVTENGEWTSLTTPAYCWYNNDEVAYKDPYGALYNWYTVNTGKLCPVGTHVPSNEEWTVLVNYLGGSGIAGGKLKESGTGHWHSPNTGATNSSGFTGLPGGYRYANAMFGYLGYGGLYWTSSEYSETEAWYWNTYYDYMSIDNSHYGKENAWTVRCIKD